MRQIVILPLLLTIGGMSAIFAQNNTGQDKLAEFIKEKLVFDCQAGMSTGSTTHLLQGVGLGMMIGHRLYVYTHYEKNWMLYTTKDSKLYDHTSLIGGGMGWRCFSQHEGRRSLDVRAQLAQSIGSKSRNCTIYDAEVHLRLGGRSFVPALGLGLRHEHSHTSRLGHQNYVYFSIGIGL